MGSQAICDTPQITSFKIVKKISKARHDVYLANDQKNKRKVVLKVFLTKKGIPSANFLRESTIFSCLSHPHILTMHECKSNIQITNKGIAPSGLIISYLALEYAEYGDLFELVSKCGAVPQNLCRTLFRQVLEAVTYMHSMGLAHLDLKVENLLIDDSFNLKLTDFDLSQNFHSASSIEGRGTPGYRAPEVKEGNCSDFQAADVYSLGIILFIMCAGIPPY